MALRHYLGIAEPGPDNWSISFPAFPGVISVGDSMADVIAHGRDALASAIDAMQEDEQPIPEDYTNDPAASQYDRTAYHDPHVIVLSAEVSTRAQRINVTMDEALLSQLDLMAERTHSSRSALLAQGARMVLATVEA